MKRPLSNSAGFSLIELTVILVVISMAMALAMQSMTALLADQRKTATEREMEMLADAITGDPDIQAGGYRSNFGYVGDNGAFPSDLSALITNPGLGTWDGPYLPQRYLQDTAGYKRDEWGQAYNYSGGLTLTSTGSGTSIIKKLADNGSDYLRNQFDGLITDSEENAPGSDYLDSVDITIEIPSGTGSIITKTYRPASDGSFTLDSLPVGQHPLRIIFVPANDTLFNYLTVMPRHKSSADYRFSEAYFD